MKVLFVSSANKGGNINPVVMNQALTLIAAGVDIQYYKIVGKGAAGYLMNIKQLREELRMLKPDVVHAHYLLSGVAAWMAGARPLLVSLMGSDVKGSWWQKTLSRLFTRYIWDDFIVKTKEMYSKINCRAGHVIPNGVDMNLFRPLDRKDALSVTGWDERSINILFPSDPSRPEKNYTLAREAVRALDKQNVSLQILKNVPREKVVYYLNASDVVLLTSRWEGSPNIIKEAMACNIPVVSTGVGDVAEIVGETDGCYVVMPDIENICPALLRAIEKKRTAGRLQISHLDATVIAERILRIYSDLIEK